jgi:cytochrome c553
MPTIDFGKMNKVLLSASILAVACVTALSAFAQEIKGDALAGGKKNALCVGCHGIVGYHIGFPEVHRVPKISGQGAKYISAALNAYRKGERKHPSMKTVAASLSDQDVADLAAFYETSGSATAVVAPDEAAAGTGRAMELVARGACTSCHGPNFSKPIDPSYPKIAGQHSDFLYVALKSYKVTDKPQIGRSHPIMGAVAKQFSNADMKELANYIGSLPGELQTVQPSRFR